MSVISAVLYAALALPVVASTAASPAAGLDPSSPQQARPDPRSDEAATVPQQVRRAEPPAPNASAKELEQSGDELREHKYYLDAIDHYRAAIAKGGENAILHNKIGIAQLQMLRLDQAKRDFKKSLKLDPKYAEARNNLGVVDYYNRNYGGAVKHYKKAIKLNPESASFHSNLGSAYFARKDFDRAMEEYARALELDPEIFERRTRGGISVHLISNEDRARYHYTLARMYGRTGNLERCLIYLRKAMEEGYKGIKQVYKDDDFAKVRKDPRFDALMASQPTPITGDSERN
jgi:tetratricopeptide (TPR) repeat protein